MEIRNLQKLKADQWDEWVEQRNKRGKTEGVGNGLSVLN